MNTGPRRTRPTATWRTYCFLCTRTLEVSVRVGEPRERICAECKGDTP